MKKYIKILSVILFVVIVLSGCSSSYFINNITKNANIYELAIDVNCEEKTFEANEKVKYVNNTPDVLNAVVFNLYPSAFSNAVVNKPVGTLNETKAYPNGKSFGTFEILSVNGNNVERFEYEGVDKSFLIVLLKTPLNPKDSANLSIDFKGTLPNILHRYGYGENTINFGNFYPVACVYENGNFIKNAYHSNGGPFYSDMASYSATISFDKNYVLASTGNVVYESVLNEKITQKIEAKGVRDFAFVLSNKFEVKSEKIGETTISYYFYDDENSDKSLKTAVDSLKTFNSLFGKYPYETMNVVKANFVYGGMEYPNLIYISDSLDNYEDYTNTIVHEMAHQWWYGLVGNNQYAYGWLDEGLTKYSTAVFYEKNQEYNVKYEDVIKNANNSYSLFVQVYEEVFGEVDTSMSRSLNQYKTEPEYVYMAYVKGMLFFDNLRQVVSDAKFFKSLTTYYELYKGKNAVPKNLLNVFERVSGYDLDGIFNSWIEGKTVVAKL